MSTAIQPWASVTHSNIAINYATCLAKLIVGQLVSKLPIFYEIRRFATGHSPKHVESNPHTWKDKVYPVHPMKAYMGNRGLIPLIFNPSAKWPWLVNSTSYRFIPMKGRRHPLNRRLGGPQAKSGRFRKEKNLLLLPGLKPLHPSTRPARSLVTEQKALPGSGPNLTQYSHYILIISFYAYVRTIWH